MPPVKQEQEEADPQSAEFVWRFHQLRDRGLAYNDAFMLADRNDVVHAVDRLLEKGCPLPLAARILL